MIRLAFRFNSVCVLAFFAGACLIDGQQALAQLSERTESSSNQTESVEITRARERAKSAEKRLRMIQRLAASGSASKKQLRSAEFEHKLSLLELSTILDPTKKERNLVVKAKLILVYRTKEWKVAKELYRRGSVTQVEFRRATNARDVALANLKSVQAATQTQQTMQAIKIARTNWELAQKEHAIAEKLFATGSLSQSSLDRAASNLKIAESELAEAKKQLGASATRMKQ